MKCPICMIINLIQQLFKGKEVQTGNKTAGQLKKELFSEEGIREWEEYKRKHQRKEVR